MNKKKDEFKERILFLIKIDANNLFNRIKLRKLEYLEIFALRRTREHFPQIFKNRFSEASFKELSCCSTELIFILDQYYGHCEEMNWYLFHTQDMPNTVEDYIDRKIIKMERLLETLNLYLEAELVDPKGLNLEKEESDLNQDDHS